MTGTRTRTSKLALATIAVLAAGCARAGGSQLPSSLTAPESPPAAARGTASTGPAASGVIDLAQQKDGVELKVRIQPATLTSTQAAHIDVTLRNDRSTVLMYDAQYCFAQLTVTAALPVDPRGEAWTGSAKAFKDYALTQGLADGGVPATDPKIIWVADGCPAGSNYQEPLAPGAEIKAAIEWKPEYVPDVPIIPESVNVQISAGYDLQNSPPSYAPGYTGIMGDLLAWVPVFNQISVTTKIIVSADGPRVVSVGQAIDAALGDAGFSRFVDTNDVGACQGNVNVYLSNNQNGGYLPGGPAWMVEDICATPSQFDIVAVDPFTAKVKGTHGEPSVAP